jgi:hypothetical protein
MSNQVFRPRGPEDGTPNILWSQQTPLSPKERGTFIELVRNLRMEVVQSEGQRLRLFAPQTATKWTGSQSPLPS